MSKKMRCTKCGKEELYERKKIIHYEGGCMGGFDLVEESPGIVETGPFTIKVNTGTKENPNWEQVSEYSSGVVDKQDITDEYEEWMSVIFKDLAKAVTDILERHQNRRYGNGK